MIKKGADPRNKKKRGVLVFNLNGKAIGKKGGYDRLTDAAKDLNLKSIGNISECCKGKAYTYKDMIFIYKDEYTKELLKERIDLVKDKHKDISRVVFKLSSNGRFIKKYSSLKQVEKDGFTRSRVREVCNNNSAHHGGFKWKWGEDKKEKEVC